MIVSFKKFQIIIISFFINVSFCLFSPWSWNFLLCFCLSINWFILILIISWRCFQNLSSVPPRAFPHPPVTVDLLSITVDHFVFSVILYEYNTICTVFVKLISLNSFFIQLTHVLIVYSIFLLSSFWLYEDVIFFNPFTCWWKFGSLIIFGYSL